MTNFDGTKLIMNQGINHIMNFDLKLRFGCDRYNSCFMKILNHRKYKDHYYTFFIFRKKEYKFIYYEEDESIEVEYDDKKISVDNIKLLLNLFPSVINLWMIFCKQKNRDTLWFNNNYPYVLSMCYLLKWNKYFTKYLIDNNITIEHTEFKKKTRCGYKLTLPKGN